MKIKDSIVWTAFLAVMAIIMFSSCSDENEAGILEITNNEIILQAEGDPVQVEVKSNTEWRIDLQNQPGSLRIYVEPSHQELISL